MELVVDEDGMHYHSEKFLASWPFGVLIESSILAFDDSIGTKIDLSVRHPLHIFRSLGTRPSTGHLS